MLLTLDIETLPCNDEQILDALLAGIKSAAEKEILSLKAPSNYKDPEKIAEYVKAKAAEINEGVAQVFTEKVGKTSFDGMYGRICCIAYAFDDGPVFSSYGDHEFDLLADFFAHVKEQTTVEAHRNAVDMQTVIVGHNVAGFDLPFLKHRALIHNVKPPSALYRAMNAKPWDNCIADTMLMWSADREKRISMDKLCKAFGIPGKDGFDGSMVAETWPNDPQKVIDYCCADVERTRELYKRLTFAKAA